MKEEKKILKPNVSNFYGKKYSRIVIELSEKRIRTPNTCVVAPLGVVVLVVGQQFFDVVVGRTTELIGNLNNADLDEDNLFGRGWFNLEKKSYKNQ